jgi:hypothetical protein
VLGDPVHRSPRVGPYARASLPGKPQWLAAAQRGARAPRGDAEHGVPRADVRRQLALQREHASVGVRGVQCRLACSGGAGGSEKRRPTEGLID